MTGSASARYKTAVKLGAKPCRVCTRVAFSVDGLRTAHIVPAHDAPAFGLCRLEGDVARPFQEMTMDNWGRRWVPCDECNGTGLKTDDVPNEPPL